MVEKKKKWRLLWSNSSVISLGVSRNTDSCGGPFFPPERLKETTPDVCSALFVRPPSGSSRPVLHVETRPTSSCLSPPALLHEEKSRGNKRVTQLGAGHNRGGLAWKRAVPARSMPLAVTPPVTGRSPHRPRALRAGRAAQPPLHAPARDPVRLLPRIPAAAAGGARRVNTRGAAAWRCAGGAPGRPRPRPAFGRGGPRAGPPEGRGPCPGSGAGCVFRTPRWRRALVPAPSDSRQQPPPLCPSPWPRAVGALQ